jgi:hypothetical protein
LSTTVPHGNEWSLGSLSHLNNLGDFEGVHFAHAAAVNTEVLSKAVDATSLDGTLARDDAVTERFVEEHVVVIGSVGDEGVQFEE